MRCGFCGKFARRLHPIWKTRSPDETWLDVCDTCAPLWSIDVEQAVG